MYKTFRALLSIVWILDIFNFECMQWLDTTVPINGWAWLLIFILIPFVNDNN